MNKVQILDKITANQIAAGEVVETPASVVKELVENALDAGATQVEVTVFEGGTEYIRVADNGSGMTRDDAQTAVLRHATSKLRTAEDLLNIATLGFRGEALPSIASVSHFSLVTRTGDADMATVIKIEGGDTAEVSETGGNLGTTIVVENLFYNVPARRKFLKSVPTELRHITETMCKLALGRTDVSFKLLNGDKEVLATSGDGDLKTAIRSLYGASVADNLLPVDYEFEGVKLSGYISKPTLLKNTRQWQSIFINGRYISNLMISKAISHAYQSMIPKSGFPFAVLQLELDRASVDVNVHPQKTEVKFSDEGVIYRAVYHALDKALTKPNEATKTPPVTKPIDRVIASNHDAVYEEVSIFKPTVVEQTEVRESFVPFGQVAEEIHKEEIIEVNKEGQEKSNLQIWPIGQVDRTFIVAQSVTSLFLIDQHAAHERILYDKLVLSHGKVDVTPLLVPIYADMEAEDVELMGKNRETLLELGVNAEPGGEKVLRINALPVDITNEKAEEFLQEIAKYLRDNRNINPAELRAEVLHMTACKAAIKAGLELNMRQMRELIINLLNTTHPFTCPHGRPCMIEITTDELYKMFKRTGF